MKKPIIVLIVVVCITIIILYFNGVFNFSNTSRINSSLNQYADKTSGFSFIYPSSFIFTHDFGGRGIISNSVNNVQLSFWYNAVGESSRCNSFPRQIELGSARSTETYTSEKINGNTVYKDIDLADWHPSFSATYAISHNGRCLVFVESNKVDDFSILDSILDSVIFK
jgi:hypothetical protein